MRDKSTEKDNKSTDKKVGMLDSKINELKQFITDNQPILNNLGTSFKVSYNERKEFLQFLQRLK